MLDVSVPCERCGAAIRFGNARCPSCTKTVTHDLRSALERRLHESSDDFRDLREQTRSASAVVLITALAYLASGVIGYLAHTRAVVRFAEDDAAAIAALVERSSIGLVLCVLSALVPRHPTRFLTAALVVWLLVQVLAALVTPLTIWHALWLKLVALVLLVRGIFAAVAADRMLRKLSADSV